MAMDQELVDCVPELRFEASLEINDRGLLHHHVTVEAKYPRIVDPKAKVPGCLMRLHLNYKELQKVFREVVPLKLDENREISVKIHVEKVKVNSLENLKNYILKHG
jgi:hypothetical protein